MCPTQKSVNGSLIPYPLLPAVSLVNKRWVEVFSSTLLYYYKCVNRREEAAGKNEGAHITFYIIIGGYKNTHLNDTLFMLYTLIL